MIQIIRVALAMNKKRKKANTHANKQEQNIFYRITVQIERDTGRGLSEEDLCPMAIVPCLTVLEGFVQKPQSVGVEADAARREARFEEAPENDYADLYAEGFRRAKQTRDEDEMAQASPDNNAAWRPGDEPSELRRPRNEIGERFGTFRRADLSGHEGIPYG